MLTPAQITQYRYDGHLFPFPALSEAELAEGNAGLARYENWLGRPINHSDRRWRSATYVMLPWVDRLVCHPRILDVVEDLIGPDILVYHSTLFLKEARTPAFVRWHQDSTYFYLEPHLHVTAWVALSEASVEAGCMRVLPGSHRWGLFEHDDRPEPMNMIRRGQGISGRFDGETGTTMPVRAGQMSLHHTDLVHASGSNDSDDRRIGYAISYIPAQVRPVGDVKPSALRVRGRDHGHFIAEERLGTPLSDDAKRRHARALARFRALQDAGFVADAGA
jgi:non-haem Fe2+, alpha-ketoglutarate-dependent halogenase